MGDVLILQVVQRQREGAAQDLWEAYLAARDKAEKSRDIADGMAAGKAWAAWLDHFRAVTA